MEKVILHCDCNNFFASVEASMFPELNNYAFAVCGDPEYRHGIILAKNEKAKKYGVQTAEPIWKAKSKCKNLVLVKPHYEKYREYSKKIFEIYCRYTDLVEPFGMDECWLDVTGSQKLFGSGEKIANELREVIKREVGVTISVGVSFNKIFAKMGSDYKKPDAVTVITKDNFKDLLYPLPAGELFTVGKKASNKLKNVGINTIGDIAEIGEGILENLLGVQGKVIFQYANGYDYSKVNHFQYRDAYKSIGNGMTFKTDLKTWADVRTCVFFLSDKVSARLRKHDVACAGLQVGIRDTSLKTIMRSCSLDSPTDLAYDLAEIALKLIEENVDVEENPIRALSITGTKLLDSYSLFSQVSFFDIEEHQKHEKEERLELARDKIRKKYGLEKLKRCSLMENNFGI
ncbi:MAG: DNA polymerase IV [Clostridia bacterium]|nr:DNA polymerase IV [Clostridia bacterium]